MWPTKWLCTIRHGCWDLSRSASSQPRARDLARGRSAGQAARAPGYGSNHAGPLRRQAMPGALQLVLPLLCAALAPSAPALAAPPPRTTRVQAVALPLSPKIDGQLDPVWRSASCIDSFEGLGGKKLTQKLYKRYTGYPGGLRERTAQEMLQKHPDDVIRLAVRRMLPKTKLGSSMLKRLKIYSGPEHPHTYAKPEKIEVSA